MLPTDLASELRRLEQARTKAEDDLQSADGCIGDYIDADKDLSAYALNNLFAILAALDRLSLLEKELENAQAEVARLKEDGEMLDLLEKSANIVQNNTYGKVVALGIWRVDDKGLRAAIRAAKEIK